MPSSNAKIDSNTEPEYVPYAIQSSELSQFIAAQHPEFDMEKFYARCSNETSDYDAAVDALTGKANFISIRPEIFPLKTRRDMALGALVARIDDALSENEGDSNIVAFAFELINLVSENEGEFFEKALLPALRQRGHTLPSLKEILEKSRLAKNETFDAQKAAGFNVALHKAADVK